MTKLAVAYRPIREALDRVDGLIRERADEWGSIFVGGKRLRPALLLFAAHAFDGQDNKDATALAAAAEIVHSASLVHDDVIDAAARRRASASLHRLIGVRPAVILADYLFVQGLTMLENISAPGIAAALIREVKTMCEGQWLEIKIAHGRGCTPEVYNEIIDKKTAALFAFCCRAGGMLRGAPAPELDRLESFGRRFGVAYQLLDDARDMTTERRGAIGRSITEWGGARFLLRAARRAALEARAELAGIASRAERRGFDLILSHIMEVRSERRRQKDTDR